MLSLHPRPTLEIPHSPSCSLNFRRLRRPTPLPKLTRRFESESVVERLLAVLNLRRR